MSEFYSLIDEYLGDDNDVSDIRVTVRRCWFYDFVGFPLRVWQGKGKLFTSDGFEWLGTVDANGTDHHNVPSMTDGRDGSSATYTMGLNLIDIPGRPAKETYELIKADQSKANGRNVTCYLAVFKENEGLRPTTPIVFFKQLIMMNTKFSEKIEENGGRIIKRYLTQVVCKDGNFGRSNVPNGTYADTIQKERARQQGVALDRGCEYLALLANRTYQLP